MADSVDMILPLLREMRKENESRHDQLLEKFAIVQKRFDEVQEIITSHRHTLTAYGSLSNGSA